MRKNHLFFKLAILFLFLCVGGVSGKAYANEELHVVDSPSSTIKSNEANVVPIIDKIVAPEKASSEDGVVESETKDVTIPTEEAVLEPETKDVTAPSEEVASELETKDVTILSEEVASETETKDMVAPTEKVEIESGTEEVIASPKEDADKVEADEDAKKELDTEVNTLQNERKVEGTTQVSSFKPTDRFFTATKKEIPVYNNDNGKNILVGYVLPNREYKISRFTEGVNWIVISFGDKNAYIRSTDVKPSTGKKFENVVNTSNRHSGFVTKSKAAVYQESSNNGTIYAYLQGGVDYSVIGKYYNFYMIDVGGRVGYIHQDNVKNMKALTALQNRTLKYFTVPKTTSIYYQSSNTDYQVGTLLQNREYQILHFSSDPNWFIISFGNKNAYIRLSDVTPSSGIQFSSPVNNIVGHITATIKSKAAAYQLPDNKASYIYAYLQPNVTYQVLGSHYNYYLVNISGRKAYVHKDNTFMKRIVIDPGHGGKFSGASGSGLQEEVMNLDLAQRVQYYLNTYYTNHEVRLTRTADVHLADVRRDDLIKRATIANDWGADVFVSIHLNASTNPGTSGYEDYRHMEKTNGIHLQNIMHKHIAPVYSSNGIQDRGKQSADFSVLRNTTMPAILTENGYMSNYRDMSKMKQISFRNQVAKAHADGIAEFLGLSKK